jgi:hypothetical protein
MTMQGSLLILVPLLLLSFSQPFVSANTATTAVFTGSMLPVVSAAGFNRTMLRGALAAQLTRGGHTAEAWFEAAYVDGDTVYYIMEHPRPCSNGKSSENDIARNYTGPHFEARVSYAAPVSGQTETETETETEAEIT